MNDQDFESVKPRKISLDQVEILNPGETSSRVSQNATSQGSVLGGMKVFKAGPFVGLFILPIMFVALPLLMVGLIFLAFFALIFGKKVFKIKWIK